MGSGHARFALHDAIEAVAHQVSRLVPLAIGEPFVRQPRGDTRVTPEDKRRAVAQRAAEIAAHASSLDTDLTRNTRAPHFTPQHWLLCHMGLY